MLKLYKDQMDKGCPHLMVCPGCPQWGKSGGTIQSFSQLKKLLKKSGLPPTLELETDNPFGSRYRAKLAVRGRTNSPKIGIFARGSHQIVDIPNCRLHRPEINSAVTKLKWAIRKFQIPPYREPVGRGVLRYLQLAVERAEKRLQLTVVANSESPIELSEFFDYLLKDKSIPLHSLWWNGNTTPNNAIFGPQWKKIWGEEFLKERIYRAELFFHPGSFCQPNLPISEKMVQLAASWISTGERVVEFYSGVGAFGINLIATKSSEVLFNEISPYGLLGLKRGLEHLPPSLQKKGTIFPGDAAKQSPLVREGDVVLADPPRKGLDPGLLGELLENDNRRTKKFIYVSCNPKTFLRDAEKLLQSNLWKLSSLKLFDQFPFTEHIELVALFSKLS